MGYKSAAPKTAPHAARAMPLHPRPSGIKTVAVAALDGVELEEDADGEEGDEEDRAAVDAKESVTLSIAQNRWARFSAEGTSEPQFEATQA
jgi:hypothetical protein